MVARVALCLLFLTLSAPLTSEAELLGTGSTTVFRTCVEPGGLVVDVDLVISSDPVEETVVLFEDATFTAGQTGGSVTISEGVAFEAFREFLTNGDDDIIRAKLGFESGLGWGGGDRESLYFDRDTDDFAGTIVESITLRIDQLDFISPGLSCDTDMQVDIKVVVEGQTAVPTSSTRWTCVKDLYRGRP